jgi:hypothetical protein
VTLSCGEIIVQIWIATVTVVFADNDPLLFLTPPTSLGATMLERRNPTFKPIDWEIDVN